jgi:hypothetical protein
MAGVTLLDTPEGHEATISFEIPPVVKAFIEDDAFVTGYFGPFGCAKTTALCFKVWTYAYSNPGARILIARDTWPNLRDTTQKTFFQWFPDGRGGHYAAQSKTFWLRHPDGPPGEIIFRAMEDRADLTNVLSRRSSPRTRFGWSRIGERPRLHCATGSLRSGAISRSPKAADSWRTRRTSSICSGSLPGT